MGRSLQEHLGYARNFAIALIDREAAAKFNIPTIDRMKAFVNCMFSYEEGVYPEAKETAAESVALIESADLFVKRIFVFAASIHQFDRYFERVSWYLTVRSDPFVQQRINRYHEESLLQHIAAAKALAFQIFEKDYVPQYDRLRADGLRAVLNSYFDKNEKILELVQFYREAKAYSEEDVKDMHQIFVFAAEVYRLGLFYRSQFTWYRIALKYGPQLKERAKAYREELQRLGLITP